MPRVALDQNARVRIREPIVDGDKNDHKKLRFIAFTEEGALECSIDLFLQDGEVSCWLSMPSKRTSVDIYDFFSNIFRQFSFDTKPVYQYNSGFPFKELAAMWSFRKDAFGHLLETVHSALGEDWWKVFYCIGELRVDGGFRHFFFFGILVKISKHIVVVSSKLSAASKDDDWRGA